MKYCKTDPMLSEDDARVAAERIRNNADPLYNPVYNVQVARVYGRDEWIVTYYRGSLD